jgi:hypothetical protein
MSSTYQIVYWRDIPASIKTRSGRQRNNRPLPERFQEAIDAAAMIGRTTNSDAYLEEWRSSEWLDADEEPEALAERLASQLEADYPDERLEKLKLNQGYE